MKRQNVKPKSERKRCLRLFFIICWQQLILKKWWIKKKQNQWRLRK